MARGLVVWFFNMTTPFLHFVSFRFCVRFFPVYIQDTTTYQHLLETFWPESVCFDGRVIETDFTLKTFIVRLHSFLASYNHFHFELTNESFWSTSAFKFCQKLIDTLVPSSSIHISSFTLDIPSLQAWLVRNPPEVHNARVSSNTLMFTK